MHATNAIDAETATAADLLFLQGAGCRLAGARPKAAASLAGGRLAFAKFPKLDDIRDITAGEILALTLARQSGINVAEHRLVAIDGQSVSVITPIRPQRRQPHSFSFRRSPARSSPRLSRCLYAAR